MSMLSSATVPHLSAVSVWAGYSRATTARRHEPALPQFGLVGKIPTLASDVRVRKKTLTKRRRYPSSSPTHPKAFQRFPKRPMTVFMRL